MADTTLTPHQVFALADARTSINHGGLIEANSPLGPRWYGAHVACGGMWHGQTDVDRLVELGLVHRTGHAPIRRAQITEEGLMELDLCKALA